MRMSRKYKKLIFIRLLEPLLIVPIAHGLSVRQPI